MIPRPDHNNRPFSCSCERIVAASPEALFEAWTTGFDRWFAQTGTLVMQVKSGQPFFFYNRDEWGRHPHYGRFLTLETNRLVEMTWLTGDGRADGTQGAETILRIALDAVKGGTCVRLTHSGFPNKVSRNAHAENWPLALDELAKAVED
ncbi:SRPBCC family protein [Sphingomicrobium marinum]|uniref:SRPBCC family protein n=1 Tax=Sphingomicrobium marinum TaxID=1227950 RepID=UPI00223F1446|nr:SRPBCC domain-containing protein [Sphingomicrobium marinum]